MKTINRNRFCFVVTIVVISIGNLFCQVTSETKAEMFRLSVLNKSTASSYLVLIAIDKKANIKKEIATTANLLSGAIKKEYSLKADDPKIDQIMLSNKSMEFEFSNPEALANIDFDLYDEDEYLAYQRTINIDSIRNVIDRNPAINVKLRGKNKDWAFDFTNEAGTFREMKTRFMFAHVLFNNGIRVYQGDVAGSTIFYHLID